MPMDEQQLSALINAAVREAVERTTQQLTAKFEADTAGLRKNRDDLLAAKKTSEGKEPSPVTHENFDEWLAGLDARMAKAKEVNARLLGKVDAPSTPPVRAHTILRAEARDFQKYQAAKAAAKAAGVELEIVDANAAAPVKASPVRFIHDAQGGILHANKRLIETIPGGLPRLRQLAAEKNAHLRLFKTVDELPDEAAAQHAEIIASQDRSNLLGDQ